MIEGLLRPSCTSSSTPRLLVVAPQMMGSRMTTYLRTTAGLIGGALPLLARLDGRCARRGAIIVAGIARCRRRAVIVAADGTHTSASLPPGRAGGEPPPSGRARAVERRCTGSRREHGRGDRDEPRPRLCRDPQRHRHQDRHAAARDAAIDHRGDRRPRHRPGRDHRAGSAALCPRRVRRRLRRGLARRLSAHPRPGPEHLSRRHAHGEHQQFQRMAAGPLYAGAHRGACAALRPCSTAIPRRQAC